MVAHQEGQRAARVLYQTVGSCQGVSIGDWKEMPLKESEGQQEDSSSLT